jgi:transcriptional regulator with XRE-family HTH domain
MFNNSSLLAIEEHFSTELISALRARYGKVPSAAFVAAQFNRRVATRNGVSQESVRRWLRGLSMPSYTNLQVIAKWLDLDVESLLGLSRNFRAAYSEQTMKVADAISRLPVSTQNNLLNLIAEMNMPANDRPRGG